MDTGSKKLSLTPQIVLTCTNLIALTAVVFSPLGHIYPMAMIGIVAFTLVQMFLPACWVNLETPICPGNFAQFFFWVQIVLVPVLIGYYGPSLGTLTHLPPERLINFAIGLRALAYISFCLGFQIFSSSASLGKENRKEEVVEPLTRTTMAFIVAFAGIGMVGWLWNYGGFGGFLAYVSSPDEQRLRDQEVATIAGALGNILRHFLGFAIVWAWSEWIRRRGKVEGFMVVAIATATVAGMLVLANFSYNRGSMIAPVLALTAAYSKHVRHISFTVAAAAGSILLLVAFVFGEYRSTSMQISELSVAEVTSLGEKGGVVDEIQIYGAGPQLTAFLLEGLESESQTQRSGTLISSILYPIPVIGKPFRETSGVVRFNNLIYGDADNFDQNIPYDAEFYMNFQAVGVILGYFLLGFIGAFLQRQFFFAKRPIASYVWLTLGIWTVFPASLPVFSQICVYSFWPIYVYAFFRSFLENEAKESGPVQR
jgi:hypothetical protein